MYDSVILYFYFFRVYIRIPSSYEVSQHRFNSTHWSLMCSLCYVKGQSNFEHRHGRTLRSQDEATWSGSRILNHLKTEQNIESPRYCLLCCYNHLFPGRSQRNIHSIENQLNTFLVFFSTMNFFSTTPKAPFRAWSDNPSISCLRSRHNWLPKGHFFFF